jgi:hypothetical protein
MKRMTKEAWISAAAAACFVTGLGALAGGTAVAQAPAPAATAAQTVLLPEGTELRIRFEERVSSGSNTTGDTFTVSLADPVQLPGGINLPAGYRGRGEVVLAKKKGMMGRSGELSVRLTTLRVGDVAVRLRSSRTAESKGAVGTTVALTVLFGPLGLLKSGHDVTINQGQVVPAFVDGDATLTMPLARPPV